MNFLLVGDVMRCICLLLIVGLSCCAVHRDIDSSVQKRGEKMLQLDAANVSNLESLFNFERLFQGGSSLKKNWRIYDTSAPMRPDGSFPVLAEGSTEAETSFKEEDTSTKLESKRDSSGVAATASSLDEENSKTKESTGGEVGFDWLRALIWGVCIGVVLIVLLWWKYGKKN